MYDLPKREKTITVEPEGYDGVQLVFATIGPEESFELMDEIGLTVSDLESDRLDFQVTPATAAPMMRLARRQLVGAKGLTIGGEPFDASDEDHRASLTTELLMAGINELLSYPFMGRDVGKDSKEPAEPSPRTSTPPDRSPTASVASS